VVDDDEPVLTNEFWDPANANNNTRVTPASAAALFENFAAKNYRPAAGGLLDGPGADHSDLLPSGAWIDWFDFNRDLEGRPFDWSVNPPRGALLPA
ncbi:hypothetical protein QO034_22100, partial [Sedimentitalea sp. JM2-8]